MPNDVNAQLLQQQLLQQQLPMNNTQNQDDEIDLVELLRAIWAGKFTIIFISMIFAVASVFFALSKPNIYKASAILAPASSEGGAGGLGALAGQFGGLASMAGINLGGGGGDKTALALEILKSRSFIEAFITKHDLLVPLMASKKWDMASDALILDEELYDEVNNKFPPTAQLAEAHAKLVAYNIKQTIENKEKKKFEYNWKGQSAIIGKRSGITEVMGRTVTGFLAWLIWINYYLSKMPNLEKRLRVWLDWNIDLFFRRDISRYGFKRNVLKEYQELDEVDDVW